MSLFTKAAVLYEKGAKLRLDGFELPDLQENQVHIRILAAALNRRDLWIQKGLYAKIQYPAILGSDGCGIVVNVANKEHNHLLGQRVIIHPSLFWGENEKAQGTSFQVLGMPTYGTLAKDIVCNYDRVYLAPKHLTNEQAAALPLAGLTGWRALIRQGKAQNKHKILITGIGGGVALITAQLAIALGCEVWITSGDETKIQSALSMGASGGILYTDANWGKEVHKTMGGFDCIIDGTAGNEFNQLLEAVKAGGTIVNYGATLGAVEKLNIHRIFWKQITIIGSTMGNDEDFSNMLDFVEQKSIVPAVDSVFTLQEIDNAFDKMERNKQFGKIIITMEDM